MTAPNGAPNGHVSPRTRATRATLVAAASTELLVAIADRCLEGQPDPVVVHPPELGMVMLTVREPVEATRFHLGEVLVTRCEVVHRDARGWAIRMGDDAAGAVAAAVLDAEFEAGGPWAGDIDALCDDAAAEQDAERQREWSAIEPTIVRFEEMD